MKTILFAIAFTLSINTWATPPFAGDFTNSERIEFARCISIKFGTLWSSFGKQTMISDMSVKFFPTEIVYFADTSAQALRKIFTIDEGVQVPVKFGSGRFLFMFSTNNPTVGLQIHELITTQSSEVESGYTGVWTIKQKDKPDQKDIVYCSIY